jgi:hypothetical protein
MIGVVATKLSGESFRWARGVISLIFVASPSRCGPAQTALSADLVNTDEAFERIRQRIAIDGQRLRLGLAIVGIDQLCRIKEVSLDLEHRAQAARQEFDHRLGPKRERVSTLARSQCGRSHHGFRRASGIQILTLEVFKLFRLIPQTNANGRSVPIQGRQDLLHEVELLLWHLKPDIEKWNDRAPVEVRSLSTRYLFFPSLA